MTNALQTWLLTKSEERGALQLGNTPIPNLPALVNYFFLNWPIEIAKVDKETQLLLVNRLHKEIDADPILLLLFNLIFIPKSNESIHVSISNLLKRIAPKTKIELSPFNNGSAGDYLQHPFKEAFIQALEQDNIEDALNLLNQLDSDSIIELYQEDKNAHPNLSPLQYLILSSPINSPRRQFIYEHFTLEKVSTRSPLKQNKKPKYNEYLPPHNIPMLSLDK